jgi:hypothetical protein
MSDVIADAARTARAALEQLLHLRGWPDDPVLSRAVDRCLQLEEGGHER